MIGRTKNLVCAMLGTFALSGCASELITQTPVTLADPSLRASLSPGAPQPRTDGEIRRAVSALLPVEGTTQAFVLCEADRETGLCGENQASLKGFGVGGLLLPLVLEVRGLEFNEVRQGGEGAPEFEIDFDVTVNRIPPFCPDADGRFDLEEDGRVTLSHDPFYCNWVVIGNVVTQFDFSIDYLDPQTRTFTGNYALQFNGTGNAVGTGYFRAFPKPPEVDAEIAEGPPTATVRN